MEPPAPARPSDPAPLDWREQLQRDELRWKIRVSKVDFLQKIVISLLGAIVVGLFYLYQNTQTQNRYYADMQSQREEAESQLRARMFDTLFKAYFVDARSPGTKDATTPGAPGSAAVRESTRVALENVGREVMLSDLLARNFDGVDVRPLFEDLDRRLHALLAPGPEQLDKAISASQQDEAFRQREQLRRVAYGAVSRQIAQLLANADASVQERVITQCRSRTSPDETPDFGPTGQLIDLPDGSTTLFVMQVGDGYASVKLLPSGERRAERREEGLESRDSDALTPLTVTFYDMPMLENMHLPNRSRVGLSVRSHLSTQSCQRFARQLEPTARSTCEGFLREADGAVCDRVTLAIVNIPEDYIVARDRPYLRNLSREATRPPEWLRQLMSGDK